MNIGQLKSVIAAYLQNSVAYFNVNSEDLLLRELNEARRSAEKAHDFAHNHVVFELTVDADEGTLVDEAEIVDPEAWQEGATVKSVETIYSVSSDGSGMTPIYHVSKKNTAIWMKERNYRHRMTSRRLRYPADSDLPVSNPAFTVSFNGRRIELQPAQDEDMVLRFDGQLWMPEYSADEDSDWMTIYGADYLKYYCICALNLYTQTFVASAESAGPPVRDRDRALAELIAWDTDWMMNGRQIKAIRS